ncbi:alpha/beta fold hydrolase [Neobacillus sp. Marseille-QA0830]
MPQVFSTDGTTIVFDKVGHGPPIIMVVGAFNLRSTVATLAQLLTPHFTVYMYDRRGRGDSGDTPPYTVDREIEDIDALISEAGGTAYVFGYSSGAVLSLKAAKQLNISKLALYEPPFIVEGSRQRPPADLKIRLEELVAADRRGEAVELFQREGVGIPENVVVQLRTAPFRASLEKMAHTLAYELAILGDQSFPNDIADSITVPTLVVAGGASPSWMQLGVETAFQHLPNSRYCLLEGQTHEIGAAAPDLAHVLREFYMNTH